MVSSDAGTSFVNGDMGIAASIFDNILKFAEIFGRSASSAARTARTVRTGIRTLDRLSYSDSNRETVSSYCRMVRTVLRAQLTRATSRARAAVSVDET